MPPKTRAAAKARAQAKAGQAGRDRSRTPAPSARAEASSPVKGMPVRAEDTWKFTYGNALQALQPGGLTGVMPCRDTERTEVAKKICEFVKHGGSHGSVLYISGMPGTGKTASVLSILEGLQKEQAKQAKLRFTVCHVNAMCLSSPAAAYRAILRQLPNAPKCSAAASAQELKSFFMQRKQSDPVVLLLVDEVDQLVTANQAVLYKVFDLLSEPRARLALVAISNTMDLPERLLPRVTSRFRIARVDYQPYNRDQIHMILAQRLRAKQAEKAFDDVVLKYCAARIAAGSGDLRKAMQVCCRAVELRSLDAEQGPGAVKMKHLQESEMQLLRANPVSDHIKKLGVGPRRFLLAVLLELRRSDGADKVSVRKVVRRYEKLCSVDEPNDNWTSEVRFDAALLLQKLCQLALLQDAGADDQDVEVGRYVQVGLDADDLTLALLAVEKNEAHKDLLNEKGVIDQDA